MKIERATGVLLHPTSLPGRFGVGDLGPAAHSYLEWLAGAGVTWWQVLPLNPPGPGQSPYAATSTFAANPLLISPELLREAGLLSDEDLAGAPAFPDHAVDFEAVVPFKERLLQRAWTRFSERPPQGMELAFSVFREDQAFWLRDFGIFSALKKLYGGEEWHSWPEKLARWDVEELAAWRAAHRREALYEEFCQFLVATQWKRLRQHARALGIHILGDLPIFVAEDSADVWAHPEMFLLDALGRPTVVAGVPPDYFSETGQLWGNPLYAWPQHRATGYRWWIDRLKATLAFVDAVRLDHFRGFAASWQVGADAQTAVAGTWVPGPGRELFDAVSAALGDLPLVAEDLGVITPDVEALRDGLGLPGMAILQFGFTRSPRSTFVPYCHRHHQIVYTGTHDNNTSLGWFLQDASEGERDLVRRYVGSDGHEIGWDLIRLALASVADLAVVPHQDIAGLGADCRMNTPGVADGNWRFRITPWMLSPWHQERLAELNWVFGRSPEARAAHEKAVVALATP